MWLLELNPMRAQCEAREAVAIGETREALEAFVARETVEPYTDEGAPNIYGVSRWNKIFRKEGPLEWFNPPRPEHEDLDGPHFIDIGTRDDWMQRAAEQFDNLTSSLPLV